MTLTSRDTWCRQNGIYYCTLSLQDSETSALWIAGNAYTNTLVIRNTCTHASTEDSDSCSWLNGAQPDVVFCRHRRKLQRSRCFPAQLSCKETLFQLPWPSRLAAHWIPLSCRSVESLETRESGDIVFFPSFRYLVRTKRYLLFLSIILLQDDWLIGSQVFLLKGAHVSSWHWDFTDGEKCRTGAEEVLL